MEHLENDMDDLFQKAGELYPLKTTESDWDAVAGKLRDENFSEMNTVPGLTSRGGMNKRRWLFLLLLIPLGFGIAYRSGILTQKGNDTVSINPSIDNQSKNSTKAPAIENKNTLHEAMVNNNSIIQSQIPYKKIAGANGNFSTKTILSNKKEKKYTIGGKRLLTGYITGSQKQNTRGSGLANDLSGSTTNSVKSGIAIVPIGVATQNEKISEKKNPDSTSVSKTISQDSSNMKKKPIPQEKHSRGFYVRLLAGPDISTVKFQSVKQPGYSAGFSVGYRFNDRLSLETGLLFDKKYYYSNGEYFKGTAGYYGSDITVDGNCKMFEIPLTLRYDFKTAKNHEFFVRGGLSSYIMTHQNYATTKNGVPDNNWPINYTMSYFPSVVQLSGGYEFSINSKTKIQIEPYVKIPLRGLGEGDLPISSAGIYFGITRSFR